MLSVLRFLFVSRLFISRKRGSDMKFSSKKELNKAIDAIGEGREVPGFESKSEIIVQPNQFRESLKRFGALGATGALFYACGSSSKNSAGAAANCDAAIADAKKVTEAADKVNDVGLLNAALNLEFEAIQVYTAAAGLPIWTAASDASAPAYLAIAGAFLAHHGSHAGELAKVIKDLGGTPITTKTATEYFTANGIADPSALGLADVLKFALKKELGAAQAYAALSANMKFVPCAALFARLASDESAHYAIFRAAFTFLSPNVTSDAAYKAAAPADIIPGAYPELWTKPA
jgi:rubrerythrin